MAAHFQGGQPLGAALRAPYGPHAPSVRSRQRIFLERPRHDMSWCCTVLSAPPWRFEITGDICPHFSSLSSSRQRADRSTPFSGVSVEAPKPLRSLTTLTCPWPFWLKAHDLACVYHPAWRPLSDQQGFTPPARVQGTRLKEPTSGVAKHTVTIP